MLDWILGGGATPEQDAANHRQLEYRLKRIESKLDVVLNELGLVHQSDGFDIVLFSDGGNKLGLVKEVKESFSYSLLEAKNLVEKLPATLAHGLSEEEAVQYKRQLEELGGSVEMVPSK